MADSIPKMIHYCWFGRGEKPQSVITCIDSWKKYLPEYQIIEWNEDNFSIPDSPVYVREAYQVKKYAFVSDYVRMKALNEYGGIYFDTDLEVLSRFEEYLQDVSLVLAFESKELLITAFIACTAHHPFIRQFMETYQDRTFIMPNGDYDVTPNTDIWSLQAKEWGADLTSDTEQKIGQDIMIYPKEIFCGFDVENYHEVITAKTKTVHHMDCSWADKKTRKHNELLHRLQKILGYKNYDRLKAIYRKLKEYKL